MKFHAQVFSKLVTASMMSMFILHANAQGPAAVPRAQASGTGSPATPHTHKHHGTPKAELFLGYSHFRAVPTYADGNRMVALNGGEASLAFNFNRHFALVADFGGYDDGQLRLNGTSVNEPRDVNSTGTAFTYMAGPRFSFHKGARVSPFVQVLGGAIHASPVIISSCAGGAACTALPSQTAFVMTAGGGLDLRLTHHITFRLIQAEYMMTGFSDVNTAASSHQNDMRLSSGIVFSFGGGHHAEVAAVPANRPPTVSCSTGTKTIYAGSGDTLEVHAIASDPDNDPLTYAWTATGGSLDGTGPDTQWNSASTTAGTYSVHVTVSDNHGGTADCSSEVRVEAQRNRQPTISCTADRNAITAGDSVVLSAIAADPDGDPLTFSWTTTGGHLSGSGPSVKLETSAMASGTFTVTGHVDDGRNGVADCTVDVSVTQAAIVARLLLHSIYFPTAQPTEQHPDSGLVPSQKATLAALATDFATFLETQPDAKLTLEGHTDPRGTPESNQRLSERRVETTRAFLEAHGIPAAALQVKAYGEQREMTQAEVEEAVNQNPQLTEEQRKRLLANSTVIVLASNRRVDVRLSGTGQESTRVFPFNAADSLTLLREQSATSSRKASTTHRK